MTISQQEVFGLIANLTGNKNTVAVPMAFVKMLDGDTSAAYLLSQLVYWTPRAEDPDGWIRKSYAQWEDEIGLSQYQVSRAAVVLEPFGVETCKRQYKRSPVLHYRVNQEVFVDALRQWVAGGKSAKKTLQPPAAEPAPEPLDCAVAVDVHKVGGKRPEFDVYVGKLVQELSKNDWFRAFEDGEQYRDYLLNYRHDLLKRLPELARKRLGCLDLAQGQALAALVNEVESGARVLPDFDSLTVYDAPSLFSLAQIKTYKLTKSQYAALKTNEEHGKNRSGVIRYCETKLNAHPLEPRFQEMMEALDACTLQNITDPGMGEAFAKTIRGKLWTSKEAYYTPEDLHEFAKVRGKINLSFIANELSLWRNGGSNAKHQGSGGRVQKEIDPKLIEWANELQQRNEARTEAAMLNMQRKRAVPGTGNG